MAERMDSGLKVPRHFLRTEVVFHTKFQKEEVSICFGGHDSVTIFSWVSLAHLKFFPALCGKVIHNCSTCCCCFFVTSLILSLRHLFSLITLEFQDSKVNIECLHLEVSCRCFFRDPKIDPGWCIENFGFFRYPVSI